MVAGRENCTGGFCEGWTDGTADTGVAARGVIDPLNDVAEGNKEDPVDVGTSNGGNGLTGVVTRGVVERNENEDVATGEEPKAKSCVGAAEEVVELTGVAKRSVVEASDVTDIEENRVDIFCSGVVDSKLNLPGVTGGLEENDGVVARGGLDMVESVDDEMGSGDVDDEPNNGDVFCVGNGDGAESTGVTGRSVDELKRFVDGKETREELFRTG
ncbi:hypothetical protein SEUCBS140593_003571 [Sporothrix eucalyptigena]|uniref:Uncharacterized protein n=1 Tax=Sporothrix eucalyptigena TaxID=1812306 RepID=A0ABP0BHA8_9PEZI